MPRRFAVGQAYQYCDWFTGGVIFLKVDSIKGNKIRFVVWDKELDGEHKRVETHIIQKDNDGNEYFVPICYRGEECRIMAVLDSDKRTKKETIDLFREYAFGFRADAREFEKSACLNEMNYALGKADAYENAAFELERNME